MIIFPEENLHSFRVILTIDIFVISMWKVVETGENPDNSED